jgi:hypothetical protein
MYTKLHEDSHFVLSRQARRYLNFPQSDSSSFIAGNIIWAAMRENAILEERSP